MSKLGEHKRVSLTTISSQRSIFDSHETGFSRFGVDLLDPDAGQSSKSTKATKTVRLELELFDTDNFRYPEFNYSKLLHLEKKKAKMLKTMAPNNGSSDPFGDNDDDVARIAKELEAKYGNSYALGRGRRKKDEFCDIGMGYDESDSFIDNTEAYDEILPEEVETLQGGFYINCGALEFKNLRKKSNTRRTDAIIKMPERSRKRVVSSSSSEDSSEDSSDSSSETEQKEAAKGKVNNHYNDNDNDEAAEDGDNNDDDGDGDDDDDDEDDDEEDDSDSGSGSGSDSDSESIDGSDSDSETLDDGVSGTSTNTNSKFKQNALKRPKPSVAVKQKMNSAKKSSKVNVVSSSSSNSPRPNAIEISDTEERQTQAQAQAQALKKVVKTTTVKDMLKAKRDSFLKSQGQLDGPAKSVVNGELKCISSTTVESSSENDNTDSASEQGRTEKLPKGKEGNDNLRTADTILPASLDKDILAHINSFKELVRSRDLCGKKFPADSKLTELLLKIYEGMLCTERNDRNMVFAHLEYQLQLPKYFMLRKAKVARAREEKNKTTNALERLRKTVAEVMPKAIANYEIELHKFAEFAAADVNSEHPPKMPRKKFQWSSELRERLYDVYQARWTSYAVLGKRKESLEQFINGYLKDKVVDLWATGWMRYEELQREIARHKNDNKKVKEKAKSLIGSGTTAITSTTAIAAANNYLKRFDDLTGNEPSRSRANSDTDSATSASSNSVKRKLSLPATGVAATVPNNPKPSAKPPKINLQKQLVATLAQMSQVSHNLPISQAVMDPLSLPYLKQFDELSVTAVQSRSRANSDTDSVKSASSTGRKRKLENPPNVASTDNQFKQSSKPAKKKKQQLIQLDTLMSQPSTSAQAAALNAAAVAAAASMLELASPTKSDHSTNNIITVDATTAKSALISESSAPINSQTLGALHSTTSVLAATRPLPHIINLDDYKCPSDILQTSHQLAANKWQPVKAQQSKSPPPQPVPDCVVRCESSSESDGVEIVGVYPAKVSNIVSQSSKPRSKANNNNNNQKSKATSVISKTGTVPNGLSNGLGFNLNNMYIYNNNNNNNNNNNATVKTASSVIRGITSPVTPSSSLGYDLSHKPQIIKTLSELKALETQMKWSQSLYKGASASAGNGAGLGAGEGAGANSNTGTSTHQ